MTDQALRAQFFVIRQNDRMVPLVALDELPDHILIRDIPRILTPRDIQGMTCVGTHDTRHRKHIVLNMNQSPATPLGEEGLSSMFQGSSESIKLSTPGAEQNIASVNLPRVQESVPAEPRHNHSTEHAISPEQSLAGTTEVNMPTAADLNPASALPPAGVKTYCSYWLRTGNCDFAQQGCMYKHEMPMHLETLQRLGHRDIPPWYRQKFGVGSFLAVDGADASFNKPDVRSRIASGSRSQSGRLSNNWRSAAAGETSDSGSDTRPYAGNVRAGQFARGSGQGSPLNPSRAARSKKVEHTNTSARVNREAVQPADLKAHSHSTKCFPHRRVSHVSVFSDLEAEIFREDTVRKAKEESDQTATESSSSKETDTPAAEKNVREKAADEQLPDKISNLGTSGGVSGAATRRRGGRGNGRKTKGREEGASEQRE